MKKIVFAASFFCSVFFLQTSHADSISDIQLPNLLPASAERPELKLNGASIRELYLLIETYVGALYLEQPSNNPEAIINSDTHKRMVFHILLKKVGARRTAKALQEALLLNLTEQAHLDIIDEIELMLSYFTGNMYAGEQSIFDYIPGVGTRVTLKGEVRGIIPGKKFYDAMLAIWIGKNPVSGAFKDDILGLNNDPQSNNAEIAEQQSL
jgi:hypothetical protein